MSLGLLLIGLGGQELLIIAIVGAAVIFGAAKLPQFMRGMGQGIKEFKHAVRDDEPPPAVEPPPPAEKPEEAP